MKKRVPKTGDIVYVVDPYSTRLILAKITALRLKGYSIQEIKSKKKYFVRGVLSREEVERYRLKVGSNAELI